MDQLVEKIKSSLAKSGYPLNKVSLSIESIKAECEKGSLSFDDLLERLKKEGMSLEITDDKIVFSLDLNNFLDSNPLQGKTKEEIGNMAQGILKNMSPDALKNMQNLFANMDEKQRKELMDKAKDLGFL